MASDPLVFAKRDWNAGAGMNLRQRVHASYENLIHGFDWNDSLASEAPILPVIHGTSGAIGWKIVKTGFASLASLDAGWYGAGMYFTSSVSYAAPYFMTSTDPAILVCLVSPGNAYPVIEDRNGLNSLKGVPVKSGYQCNYVVTRKNGSIQSDVPVDQSFDEFVIPQESQIVPIYLIQLNYNRVQSLSVYKPPPVTAISAPLDASAPAVATSATPIATHTATIDPMNNVLMSRTRLVTLWNGDGSSERAKNASAAVKAGTDLL